MPPSKASRRRKTIVAAHLDLKGVLFKPSYFAPLMKDLASQGVNTVLVEYEDVFPFKGLDIAFDPRDRWTPATLDRFLRAARAAGLEVIPLQQCLGHLEYLFRWGKYRRFAEVREYPGTLCLSNPDGKALVLDLLCQVMAAHPDSRFVHLGLDEAHRLATCPACAARGDALTTFLRYLDELCDVCDAYGKVPILWSDMLEDHFRPGAFDRFRDRVVLAPWDYAPHGAVDAVGRLAGFRLSRRWLDAPDRPEAPAVGPGHAFVEDYPPAVRKAVAPYRRGSGFLPLFQADLWTDLGFRVLGATVVRSSSHLSVLPDFNHLRSNIAAWGKAAARTRALGLVGTSWARGTTFCPPGFNMDLTWPGVAALARALGRRPRPFWPGVPARTVERIVGQLGRCRKDWSIEERILGEMDALRPRLRAHRYEWDSLRLMARVVSLHRRADFALLEVDFFHANARPVDDEWTRRRNDEARLLQELARLREEVRAHFGRRYAGDAFEEWVRDLFDLREQRLRDAQDVCREKGLAAARFYSSGGTSKPK